MDNADSSGVLPGDRREEGDLLPEEAERAGGEIAGRAERGEAVEGEAREEEGEAEGLQERDAQVHGVRADLRQDHDRKILEEPEKTQRLRQGRPQQAGTALPAPHAQTRPECRPSPLILLFIYVTFCPLP